MRKIIFIVLVCLLITVGCSNIRETTVEEIIERKVTINYNNKIYNINHRGYKYYLPKSLSVKTVNETNEIITSNKYTYYLYLDLVGYYNGVETTYEEEPNLYKSLKISYKENVGYLKVKELNDDYLVEIMYNYAKIEVIVNKEDLNLTINNAITILSTITYNKEVIAHLMEDNLLNYQDESLNLFEQVTKEDNFIRYEEQYDDYENNNTIPDYDVIN